MITVYQIIPVAMFQSLELEDDESAVELTETIYCFDGRPMADEWSPPELFVRYPNLKAPDIWSVIIGENLGFEQRAAEVLHDVLVEAGELLPLYYEGRRLEFLNVTRGVDCLDRAKCENTPGVPLHITKFAFKKNLLGPSLFKIPALKMRALFTVEGVNPPDREFRPLVEKHGFKGLYFDKLWSDDE